MPTTQAQTIAPHWEESTVQDPVSQKWKKWSMCLYCKKKFSSLKPDKKCAHTGKVPKHGICRCPADVPEDRHVHGVSGAARP